MLLAIPRPPTYLLAWAPVTRALATLLKRTRLICWYNLLIHVTLSAFESCLTYNMFYGPSHTNYVLPVMLVLSSNVKAHVCVVFLPRQWHFCPALRLFIPAPAKYNATDNAVSFLKYRSSQIYTPESTCQELVVTYKIINNKCHNAKAIVKFKCLETYAKACNAAFSMDSLCITWSLCKDTLPTPLSDK